MIQFDRQYRFSAGKAGGEGFEVGQTSAEHPTALHISFSVEKADTETPNTTKMSLWNLNPEHLAILNSKDCIITLRAGYDTNMTLIFIGVVTHVTTSLDSSDMESEIEAADGLIELRDCYVTISYTDVINTRKIIEDIAANMGVAVTFSYNAQFADLPNGFSFIGAGRTALDKACATTGLQWQIENGVLQIKMKGDTMTREVYLLSAETGLIGIPKKIKYSADETHGAEQPGWEVEYLLNGAIGMGDFIRLETKLVKGYFRVRSVEMSGDNLEGDWKCDAKLIEA